MSVTGKKIVIIGGGMAGLSFAAALELFSQERGVAVESVKIVDRDERPEDKDFQNYSLSIRTDSGGVQALKTIGVLDDALKFQTCATEGFCMATHTNTDVRVLFRSPQMNPEASGFRPIRFGLWKSIFDRVPESTEVVWGRRAVKVVQDDSKQHPITVELDDGTALEADFVVVADGSQSEVRKALLPSEAPSFTGLVLLCGTSNQDPPPELLNRHGLVLGNDGISMFIGHEEPGKTVWAVCYVSSEPHEPLRVRTATESQQEEILKEAISKLTSWPEGINCLVASSDLKTIRVVNGYDKLPHTSLGKIAFIGDSNHPVTPFSANGANMALVDGVSLAREVTDARHNTLEEALAAFDKEMFPRATQVVQTGRKMIAMSSQTGYLKCAAGDAMFRAVGLVMTYPTTSKVVTAGIVAAFERNTCGI